MAAIARRRASDAAVAARSTPLQAKAATVIPGRFIGTAVLRGPPAMPMTDAQYCDYLEVHTDPFLSCFHGCWHFIRTAVLRGPPAHDQCAILRLPRVAHCNPKVTCSIRSHNFHLSFSPY